MSSSFDYTYVTPQPEDAMCHGSGCYCFTGTNQFNDDISSISSAASMPSLEGFSRDRNRTLSFEDNRDTTLMECDLCLSLRDNEEVFYCGNCELGSCEGCRDAMISAGGLDCFEGEQNEYLCPACYRKSRQHLFFDKNGGEISREVFLQQEEDDEWGFLSPTITRGTFRHPRVLLNFLRYIDSHNEVANTDEYIFLKAIPRHIYEKMIKHTSIQNPVPEFETDVNELLQRLENHLDRS